jgi:hypothetical protein
MLTLYEYFYGLYIANKLVIGHKIVGTVTVECFGHVNTNTVLVALVECFDIVIFNIVPRAVFIP